MPQPSAIAISSQLPGVRPRVVVVAGLWLLGVFAGMAVLLSYDTRPGVNAIPPARWPQASGIERAAGLPTLLVLAHPSCSCTRATIGELARLMAAFDGRVDAHVLFLRPDGAPAGWEQTDVWRSAAAIPGVVVGADVGGAEAETFHTMTSGQTILYDAAGNLRFSGGITPARGEEGENLGLEALATAIMRPRNGVARAPVFGCLFRRRSES